MKKENRKYFCTAALLLAAFVLWTALLQLVDVQPIGPLDSAVGFATFNRFVHNLTGVNFSLYTLTDWLGLVPIGFAAGFAMLGIIQWITRKNILRADRSLWVLGGFYIVVAAVFVFFEVFIVNYRPVLIDGALEASYPSSTTMLVLCIIPTAALQLHSRISNSLYKRCLTFVLLCFTAFMVVGRLISGVHWATDIIGGILLSAGLVTLYYAITRTE